MNLRLLAEKDLGLTLEGDWSVPVELTDPDGVRYTETVDGRPLAGQVLYNITREDPETGGRVVVNTPVVTLRRSSLVRVPEDGETWVVRVPVGPLPTDPVGAFAFSPSRPLENGANLGFLRLYLQQLQQDPDAEAEV